MVIACLCITFMILETTPEPRISALEQDELPCSRFTKSRSDLVTHNERCCRKASYWRVHSTFGSRRGYRSNDSESSLCRAAWLRLMRKPLAGTSDSSA